jgi:hypothetical protein
MRPASLPILGDMLQKSFCLTDHKFSGLNARRSNIDVGATSFSDELTGDFGGAFEGSTVAACFVV